MKRGFAILFLMLAFAAFAMLAGCSQTPLSEAERQQRAEDFARLTGALKTAGYDNSFSIKESLSLEENLRRLWSRERAFIDARKNAELLVALGNFDFIAEGLQTLASEDNPHYADWPRDSRYVTSSTATAFRSEEVLWLMLLLQDADFPEAHFGLREVLVESGANVLQRRRKDSIWFYYEMTAPGLLDQVQPSYYWGYKFPEGMADAFRGADDAIRSRFMQAIDAENFRSSITRPTRAFSFAEAEQLLQAYPTKDPWKGGYIRVKEPFEKGPFELATTYEHKSDELVAVTNPAEARFAVYEEYTDRVYYSTYNRTDGRGDESIDVYLWHLNIRIVDLVTGEVIFQESVRGNPPPETISYLSMFHFVNMSGGDYYHDDFDYDRYAAVMVAHMNKKGDPPADVRPPERGGDPA